MGNSAGVSKRGFGESKTHLRGVSLRVRIFALVLGLVLTTMVWSAATLWFTSQTSDLIVKMGEQEVAALIAAQGLENALTMQKGYATYFLLNENQEWLAKLRQYRRNFEQWLVQARNSVSARQGRELLNRIETEYLKYIHYKDQVLDLYQAGDREKGAALHWEVRRQFETIYQLCEEYKGLQEANIDRSVAGGMRQARLVKVLSWTAVPVALCLGLLLAYVLLSRIFRPIRKLAEGGGSLENCVPLLDEVKVLSNRMQSLVDDVDQTHSKLKQSQAHLKQSEKLALVGKLAAGVAHSIRNPLTSVKMRLFSLERSLKLNEVQKEDLEVISEEIRHLDTIVRNFLEFARPPKLKVDRVSPSDVVDTTLTLLKHRLESCNVEVAVQREESLPAIDGDADQLKEVLANLILNACEAMPGGGRLTIQEEEGVMEPQGKVVILKISDTGTGIAENIRDEVFQPFFSTKEEGTGLGLSIAKRIMEEHGGWIHLSSSEGRGTTFVLGLPARENPKWHRS